MKRVRGTALAGGRKDGGQAGLRAWMWCTSLVALCASTPALCGEEILYQPAPDWIAPVDLDAAAKGSTTNLVILDRQSRLGEGGLWDYSDTALRIGTAQELTQAGTIGATWLPDKGDLIVHEVSIIRGGQTIDVLGQGGKLSILRREQSLEQRILDGELTATLAVPGLQVGDIVRTRYSVTRADQALGDEVESVTPLFREPDVRAGFARVLVSWDEHAPVRYSAGPNVELPAVTAHDGSSRLELALPLAKAEDMPMDAPGRYLRPPLLQVGTFADWAEVGALMAPYYAAGDAIAPGSELAAKASAIVAAHKTPLSRAVAALELVQEEIGYLANGLDGGNYLPQSPQQTWELRYGDCKAKTKLLLALLAAMNIDAEAVLVSTQMGDALPQMLPMAAVFDHVLVRASIDGHQYWLDGTSAGANEAIIGNVPPFEYGLPIRATGSALEPIVQELPRIPEGRVAIQFDERAGVDLPVLVTTRFDLVGVSAAYLTANRDQATQDQLFDLGNSMVHPLIGLQQVTDIKFDKGADDSELTVTVTSLRTSLTQFDGAQGDQILPTPVNSFAFNPDRARRQWREIPVNVGGKFAADVTLTVILPEGAKGYTLLGPAQIDETIAGRHLVRSARIEGGRLLAAESITGAGGEIAPADIADERRRATALTRNQLKLRAPLDAGRRWRFAGQADRAALKPIDDAYAAIIARKPDEADNYANRARFRLGTFDFGAAVEDFTKAIELESSADLHGSRAQAYAELLEQDKLRDDLDEAYALDATPWRAMALANAMADTGDIDGARDLLDQQDGDETVRQSLAVNLAELDAREGDKEAGLARIDALLADKPNDAALLNNKCWYMGTWDVSVAEALPICTRAVENAQNSAGVLDSRALVYLRNNRLDEALADADAALAQVPGQTQTLLLRGLILRARGDSRSSRDLREALARSPSLGPVYKRYGLDPGS